MSEADHPVSNYADEGWEQHATRDVEADLSLNVEEILERTQVLVDALGQLDDLGRDLAAMRQEYKKRRDALDEQVSRLRAELKDRRRKTKVKAVEWRNYAIGLVHLVDVATGRVVEVRTLTAEERQAAMPLPPPQPARDPDAPLVEGEVESVLDGKGAGAASAVLDELEADDSADNLIRLPPRGGDDDEVDEAKPAGRRRGPRGGLPPEPGDAPKRGPQRRRV